MNKYFLLLLIFSLLIFSLNPLPVSAHTLKIDGNFGITLHIDPDDEPIAGQESKILFDIQDKNKQFIPTSPGNCDCTLQIQSNGKKLANIPLVSGNQFTQVRYTFPKVGTYTLFISGKWNGIGTKFDSFTATFNYYVAGNNQSSRETIPMETNTLKEYLPFVILMSISSIVALVLLSIHISSYE